MRGTVALPARLEKAEQRLRKAQTVVAAIEKRLAARHWTELDSATGSGIRRKPNARADARRFNSQDRDAAAYVELETAEKELRVLSAQIAAAKRNAPVPYTTDDLKEARAVRTTTGWHPVARVNAKSVTVLTGYSWTDRIAHDLVLEVRK